MAFIQSKEISEKEIIEQIIAGDKDAFEWIMRRYNQRLYRIGIGYLNDPLDVEDAIQSAYLNCFKALNSFQFTSSFSTWLVRILINECHQINRKQKKMRHIELTHLLPEQVISPESGDEEILKKEMNNLLEQAILSLPEKYKSVYMLRAVEQVSTSETASILQLSESNIKIRLLRAKELLKQELVKRAGEVEVFTFGSSRCDSIVWNVLNRIKL